MKVFCLNNISKKALDEIKAPNEIVDDMQKADSILVRSFKMHDTILPKNVLAVARAGAGVNNIPLDKYQEAGVVVFNTPGANANAVKELTLCGMLLAARDVIGGIKYIEANKDNENIASDAEKAKAKYAGIELLGKKVAVIGLGVIGVMVANSLVDLGCKVVGYDPYLSITNAMKLSRNVLYATDLKSAVSECDFVTIHVPLMDSTKKMMNKEIFDCFKDNTVFLNFSRDKLVDEEALKQAISEGKVAKYITDFANPNVLTMDKVICLPHLGASTEEAEDNCAFMAIKQLEEYLTTGSIVNSVNYPNVKLNPKMCKYRICINHKNIPGMIASFTSFISSCGGNIESFVNQSRGEYAYSVLDVNIEVDIESLEKLDGVIRVRVI